VLSLRRGRVTAVVERHHDLARLEVDGTACVAYPQLTGPVALGDDVIVNVQGRELGLGSGGFDILYANLSQGLELAADPGAHVMKLPYCPLQFATRHGEESAELPEGLDGMPVVACSLHSQVAPVCAGLAGLGVGYLQLPGGALPVALSNVVRTLEQRGLLKMSVGVDSCFGGDVDAVNVYSALVLARAHGTEAVVCAIGPGIVGTATTLGHGGMAAATALAAASELGGRPVLALRMSAGDARTRHAGVSHHSQAVVSSSAGSWRIAWPEGCPFEPTGIGDETTRVDVSGWREACEGLPLEHMGRGPDEDPWFFASAFAAGRLARQLAG
jgi:Protein of unknown function (DUF3866)